MPRNSIKTGKTETGAVSAETAPVSVLPKKWRGQHFLTDKNMLKKIVLAANIQTKDTVVEIGAGTGNLTALLAEKAKRVIAIEIDSDLIPILRDRIAQICHSREGGNPVAEENNITTYQCNNEHSVEIVQTDARAFNPTSYKLQATSYLVVANIPYNITSFLIRRLLEASQPPSSMILLVQKEVAQRICAHPPYMSILSVAVQYYATPRILFSVPRTCFSPRPNVDSAVIEIKIKIIHPQVAAMSTDGSRNNGILRSSLELRHVEFNDSAQFFKIVTTGFAHKRKLLASNLTSGLHIPHARIDEVFRTLNILPTARAQELSLEQWKELHAALFHFTEH